MKTIAVLGMAVAGVGVIICLLSANYIGAGFAFAYLVSQMATLAFQ